MLCAVAPTLTGGQRVVKDDDEVGRWVLVVGGAGIGAIVMVLVWVWISHW